MTRINVVPVEELTRQHLQGEYKEITRVFTLARNASKRGINKYNFEAKMKAPKEYTLGTGHVKFFMDKLGYILNRYQQLTAEMIRRGYSPNPVPSGELVKGLDKFWLKSYNPTPEALEINRKRIQERLADK